MMRDVTVELGKFGQAPGQAFCQSALERILAQLCAQLRCSYDDVLQIDEERREERYGARGEQKRRFKQSSHLQDDVVAYIKDDEKAAETQTRGGGSNKTKQKG
ncbi:hypothetical protein MKX08_003489 [Trichoderma sp. CBMAI-0020]|nr:hypothetical protein MKX08_003489 [Trichoderma sp. CBMAI-0020]